MNLIATLQAALYVISEALLYPIMLILLVVFALVILRAGEVFSEWLRRRTTKIPEIDTARKLLNSSDSISDYSPIVRSYITTLRNLPGNKDEREVYVAYKLQELEDRLADEINKFRWVIRLAPMMGLMGTLIPMGSALAALTEGNMDVMANNLIIAFTTTVVGLFLGGLAYFLSIYKTRWIREDRRVLQLLAELALGKE